MSARENRQSAKKNLEKAQMNADMKSLCLRSVTLIFALEVEQKLSGTKSSCWYSSHSWSGVMQIAIRKIGSSLGAWVAEGV